MPAVGSRSARNGETRGGPGQQPRDVALGARLVRLLERDVAVGIDERGGLRPCRRTGKRTARRSSRCRRRPGSAGCRARPELAVDPADVVAAGPVAGETQAEIDEVVRVGCSQDVPFVLDDGDIADVGGVGATQSRTPGPLGDRGPPLACASGGSTVRRARASANCRQDVRLEARAGSGSRGSAACSSSSAEAAVEQGLVPGGEGDGLSDGDPLDPPQADTSRPAQARAARTLTGCSFLRQLIEDALRIGCFFRRRREGNELFEVRLASSYFFATT